MTGPLKSRLLLALVAVLAIVLASAPLWLRLPIPETAIRITAAEFSLDGAPPVAVSLPHRWEAPGQYGPATGRYTLTIDVDRSNEQILLIPAAQHILKAYLDGMPASGSERQSWGEPVFSSAYALRLPVNATGPALLTIELRRIAGAVPGFLSAAYLTDEQHMSSLHWVWALAGDGARSGVIGLQALVVLCIAIVWLTRRHDATFAWLCLIGGMGFLPLLATMLDSRFTSYQGQSLLVFILPAQGAMSLALAMTMVQIPRPLWLKLSIIAIPAALTAGVSIAGLPQITATAISVVVSIGFYVAATAVLVASTVRTQSLEQALFAVPLFLTAAYGLRDAGILAGLLPGDILLTPQLRPATILAVFILLMMRLASSLGQVDRINETLRNRLSAREAELSTLHQRERAQAARRIREEERNRLMRDLHDGVSGHLVSIIALSQKQPADLASIERGARSALDDLRLVIHSLDLGDTDLVLALAGLRERLEPQLRRHNTELDWSMENLPPVTGVTPANALSTLRVVQEAVTNAIKHGTPGRLAIRGSATADGMAVITVRNNVAGGKAVGSGHGLRNMARRAEELGGRVAFSRSANEAVLELVLPGRLPDD